MRFPGITGVCFVLLLATPCLAVGEAHIIDALKQQNARLITLACDFTQETRIPMFDAPVISTGRMLFKRPDAVLWEYVTPMREGFAMQGVRGVRWRDDRKMAQDFAVSVDPVGSVIARQLLAWMTLDLERIGREYDVAVSGQSPPELTLTPKRADVAGVLTDLIIAFTSEGVAQSVTIKERQGGVTVIRFTGVRINGLVPDEEFR